MQGNISVCYDKAAQIMGSFFMLFPKQQKFYGFLTLHQGFVIIQL
jgi:hypothetical protein